MLQARPPLGTRMQRLLNKFGTVSPLAFSGNSTDTWLRLFRQDFHKDKIVSPLSFCNLAANCSISFEVKLIWSDYPGCGGSWKFFARHEGRWQISLVHWKGKQAWVSWAGFAEPAGRRGSAVMKPESAITNSNQHHSMMPTRHWWRQR